MVVDTMSDTDSNDTAHTWSEDIHGILRDLLHNCDELQKHHKQKYLINKKRLSYFRIPIILISSANSVFSLGLSSFISQQNTSLVNCLLSLLCGTIGAVELFLQINRKLEQSILSYQSYKLLSVKISAELKLNPSNRKLEGTDFLGEVIEEYRNLFEKSTIIRDKLNDKLILQHHVIKNVLGGIYTGGHFYPIGKMFDYKLLGSTFGLIYKELIYFF